MERCKARVEGREQSRHRVWMRIVVAVGPSIDAESAGVDADNTDREIRRNAEMNSLRHYTGYLRTAFKGLERGSRTQVSGWWKKERRPVSRYV